MNRRIIVLITLIVVLFSASKVIGYEPPLTKPNDRTSIVNDANDFIGFPYFREYNVKAKVFLNLDIWRTRSLMVYGDYSDASGNERDPKSGEYRYLGKTMYNENFTNINFPHDEFAGGYLEDRRWVAYPWQDTNIQSKYKIKKDQDFDGIPDFNDNIKQGLKMFYKNNVRGTNKEWYNYVHILQPPTYWSEGRGEMWHITGTGSNTKYWYITIPLAADKDVIRIPDYKVLTINPGTDLIEDGITYKGSVIFAVNDNFRKPTAKARVTLKINGVACIENREIEIAKGKTLLIPFTYQGKAKTFTYTATITAVDPDGDTDLKNNSLTVTRYCKYIDVAATNLTSLSPIKINTPSTASVLIKNLGTDNKPFDVNYYLNDKLVKTDHNITLGRNGSISKSFTFLAPNTPGTAQLKVIADPNNKINDINRTNNTTTKNIFIEDYLQPPTTCDHNSYKLTGQWNETYYIITGYPTKYLDVVVENDEGEPVIIKYSYTDFSDPIWEPRTVTYSESLTAVIKVNTKQGIPTDRNNPKESDRESRGSWEIIPWAKSKGLDPNEVTRAGYGFEVTVDTTYWTDYETKIPRGLENTPAPKGGTLYGPIKIKAELWDTNNRFAGRYDLEAVSGIPGGKVIKWALPEVKRELSNGETFYDRKHYTDVKIPDGNYDVVVSIEAVGKNGLKCCLQETVIIHGDMYDDIYTRPST